MLVRAVPNSYIKNIHPQIIAIDLKEAEEAVREAATRQPESTFSIKEEKFKNFIFKQQ